MDASFDTRLRGVAAWVAIPEAAGLGAAVRLAEDMVAGGEEAPAVVAVAGLPREVTRRDGETLVRKMLEHLGIAVPSSDEESDHYSATLRAFAFMDLPFAQFEGQFYSRLNAWDRQSDLDRELVTIMVNDLECTTDPREIRSIQERIRLIARQHLERGQTG